MSETDILKKHISSRIALEPDELDTFTAAFKLKSVKKKQLIIQPDFVARVRSYVVSGAFRSYVIDKDGMDHTIQFAVEDWWIGDINSYYEQKPATLTIVALEDSKVFQIDLTTERALMRAN